MKQKLLSMTLLVSSFTFAQSWNLTGNSGTNSSGNFIGTTDNQPLVLKTNSAEAMRILPDGKIRVGINDPKANGAEFFRIYKAENPVLEVASSLGSFQITKSTCDGCFGGKTGDTVLRNISRTHNIILSMPNDNNDGQYYVGVQDLANGIWVKFFNNATARFDGKIFAKEVEVKANVWADYVFQKDYKLNTLEQVEKHIQEKGHLPNMPSAEKVMQDGINVAEMNAKLLEKIEELTLYSIQQNKQIKNLQEENKTLKSQSHEIEELKKQVQQILSTKK
ncbi:cell wall anchor protein [Chryseobacterium sp. OV279]|uniref:cell wall anchor protein n=1 Tax=Chryseobacterium sp. OV279 TaxID=1500285 RepID=UPI0009353BDD|nr:cell wall anchor protein [Chryseobacterium sp. OV279]